MNTNSPTIIHAARAEAGRKGGLSTSPAKVAATRANIAKAREAMRAKREAAKLAHADGEPH